MPPQKIEEPALLKQVMQSDQYRLRRSWRKLHARGAEPTEDQIAEWMTRVKRSAELRELRRRSIPQLEYNEELPITAHKDEIIELLKTRQTIVVCGETGSGKSTQLPKFCLEAGLGQAGVIGHTQPRRLAARAVASRVAEELQSKVGEKIGFKIRFTDTTDDKTLIKLMTDGILLAETQSDRFLDRYDALIIDEAHERSLNIDFLLGYLRKISSKRPDLKLIITSATIDPEKFSRHFADENGAAPIIEVSGRTYPVDLIYQEPVPASSQESEEQTQLRAIANASEELIDSGPGDILVFLPTERDIRLAAKHLRGYFSRQGKELEILPLYARLSQADQNRIFSAHAKRRIVLATNVAESSLTVPGIHYVIDTGLVRISRYAPRSKVQRLPIEPVSQASANQRAGRCGRLGPGICIRLFSEEDYLSRRKFTTPEIRRSDLASVLLQSKVLKLGDLTAFPLLDPPSSEAMRDAVKTLVELNAIDRAGGLTEIGKKLGRLPCEPRVGRMLLESDQLGCVHDLLIIAGALEAQDVRQRPTGQRDQADEAHAEFLDPHSDFLSYLRLWDFYERLKNKLGRSRLEKALSQKFLSYQRYREWHDVVRQLKQILNEAGIQAGRRKCTLPKLETVTKPRERNRDKTNSANGKQKNKANQRPAGYDAIHQALLSGLLSGIAQRSDGHEYQAAGNLKVALWPGSGLFRQMPRWIVSAELVETNKRYARTLAEVEVGWIEQIASQLLKHSYYDPHWSKKAGAAMVYRRSTLYGLPVVVGRRQPLGPIDKVQARDLFIEHGLVEGQIRCNEKFYLHNQELAADLHELVQRTRSANYIVDRYHLLNFYQKHMPESVYDVNTLRSWLKKHAGKPAEQALWLRPEDLMDETIEHVVEDFPNELQVGQTKLPLQYHFEPGSDTDGVATTVPQATLRQLSEDRLDWLVPGLIEEKVQFLIRSLPKQRRTAFVPVPDVSKKITARLREACEEQPFARRLCQELSNYAQEIIQPDDFQIDKLPDHLRLLVHVVDDEGKLVASGRDVSKLVAEFAPSESTLDPTAASDTEWDVRTVTASDFDQLPRSVAVRRAGIVVEAYPALVDTGDRVEARLVDTPAEAARLSHSGFTRLFINKHRRSLRSQVQHLPGLQQAAIKLSGLLTSEQLRAALLELIARVAFLDDKPIIRDRTEFEARTATGSAQIAIAAQEVSSWLPKLGENYHRLRLAIEKGPSMWLEVIDDINQQMSMLLHPRFLSDTPWLWLKEFPRYLAAMQSRLEKLTNGGLPKDRKLREPISEVLTAYHEVSERNIAVSESQRLQLDQARWLIEEFRVSIFAQQLGTKQTVSKKRILEVIATSTSLTR